MEYAADGRIGRLTFDNPSRLNAMTLGMWRDLAVVAGRVASDPDVRVLVVTGAGDRAFVSGSDISGFGADRNTEAAADAYGKAVSDGLDALARLEKPTIAVIGGACIGGGLSIAAACDLRLAARNSVFAVPAARIGVGYAPGQVTRLQRLIGPARLRELIYTARKVGAEEAQGWGLLNEVLDPEILHDRVAELATDISGLAPLTQQAAKLASLATEREVPVGTAQEAVDRCFGSEDYREGQAAFREKRPPDFSGR
ncbi:enoyl-CoA hydratase [Rhodobacterales bacterium HKCCE2091]|nr:enoyl-CoA hydratase [Rhodobacterales bacterium HKCCE2091]